MMIMMMIIDSNGCYYDIDCDDGGDADDDHDDHDDDN